MKRKRGSVRGRLTVGGDGFAFFDRGSLSSDSFSSVLSSFIDLDAAVERLLRGVTLLFLALALAGFRFGDSCGRKMIAND